MKIYIFLYNVIHIKSDFSKLRFSKNQKIILIANEYCLSRLKKSDKLQFDHIHELMKRDFHSIDTDVVDAIVQEYVVRYGSENIMLLTNEDSAQLTCATLREKYGIQGPSVKQILPFVNKVISKQKIGDAVRLPKFLAFDKLEYAKDKVGYLNYIIEKLGFPMFSKPIDMVSSIGARSIPNADVLKDEAELILRSEYDFEIDEYIEGELFHCDAFVINGEIKFFKVGRCSVVPGIFCEGYNVGSLQIENDETISRLKAFCKKVFERLHCHSSAYHLEAFLEKGTKDLVFLEVGARTGGALISQVCEKTLGINIEEKNYLIQMGLIDDFKVECKNVFSGFYIFPKIQGMVSKITKPHLNIKHQFTQYVQEGDIISNAENLLDMSCAIVFWDEDYQKVIEAFNYLKDINVSNIVKLHQIQAPIKIEIIHKTLFDMVPFVFWKNLDNRYLGSNHNQVKNLGFKSEKEFVGKTIAEINLDPDQSALIHKNDSKVIESEKIQIFEEELGGSVYLSQKGPIRTQNGHIIGMLGFSVDITNIKKSEREAKNNEVESHRYFKAVVDSVSHSMMSSFAALMMVVDAYRDKIEEQLDSTLCGIANSIKKDAEKLEKSYSKVLQLLHTKSRRKTKATHIILSASLLEILDEKKYQYGNWPIKFSYNFFQHGFDCIEVEYTSFKHMIYNIIDNAIESMEDQFCHISITLSAQDQNSITISILDNGKGMSESLVSKILAHERVTVGKRYGKGLGFLQITESVRSNNGKIHINSTVGKGTQIMLTFNKAIFPTQLGKEIILNVGDTVVILDDNRSIHRIWHARFEQYLDKIDLRYFTMANEVLAFLKHFAYKERVFLLVDSDLLNQKITSIDVIRTAGIKRSFLIADDYTKFADHILHTDIDCAIMPKSLITIVPIKIKD